MRAWETAMGMREYSGSAKQKEDMATENRIEFCGCFGGSVKLRKGETAIEALERVEKMMQAAVDSRKSLDVNVGVDFGDFSIRDSTRNAPNARPD